MLLALLSPARGLHLTAGNAVGGLISAVAGASVWHPESLLQSSYAREALGIEQLHLLLSD